MKITATFIDEISHDIPSANWGPKEWAKDFDAMKAVGIDTVVIIRAGYKNMVTFESKAIKDHREILPVPYDLVDVFLNEAERCGMDLFFGTYDSGQHWMNGDYQDEVDINKAFTTEFFEKYGHREAFKGWYICHEIDTYNESAIKVYRQLAKHLKALKDVPILISPYIHGKKQFGEKAVTLEQHRESWDKVFSMIKGYVDIVAFQDGNVDFDELGAYMRANLELAKSNGLTCWSNVESFDRDMPIKFLPIGWPKLLHKMQTAGEVGVDKLITFEFSHFLSPNSMYNSAHGLYDRYRQWIAEKSESVEDMRPKSKGLHVAV